MSVTVEKIYKDAMALLDEYSEDGVEITDEDNADLLAKAIRFTDMAQNELYKDGNVYAEYEYAHSPITNLLGDQFGLTEFEGETTYFPNEYGVDSGKSYHISVDMTCTINIQELQSTGWTTIATHSVTGDSTYQSFKGNLTLVDNGDVRFEVVGDVWGHVTNYAFFEYKFDTVPDYMPWFELEMPSNFRSTSCLVEEYPTGNYNNLAAYKIEGFDTVKINWYFSGQLNFIYNAIPTQVTSKTDVLEVDGIMSQSIAYYVASKLALFEYPSAVTYFEEKYNEMVYKLTPKQGKISQVQDSYSKGW